MKQQGFASYITQMKQVGLTSMGQERLQEALQRERSAARVRASARRQVFARASTW